MMEETRTLLPKIDRAGWARGPWDNEPDRIEWRDSRSTPVLACLVVRGPSGALCGYVAVPKGHPWHGKDMTELWRMDCCPEPHGSVTYANRCQDGGAICHVAQPGESDDVWWVGFDCAHGYDVAPGHVARWGQGWSDPGATYKTEAFVRREVQDMADAARKAVK